MTTANARQVGGEHYKNAKSIEVWDFITYNKIPYLEGNCIRYVARNRKKHAAPEIDLEKVAHYLEKIKEVTKSRSLLKRFYILVCKIFFRWEKISGVSFSDANQLTYLESEFCVLISRWLTLKDIEMAEVILSKIKQGASTNKSLGKSL